MRQLILESLVPSNTLLLKQKAGEAVDAIYPKIKALGVKDSSWETNGIQRTDRA